MRRFDSVKVADTHTYEVTGCSDDVDEIVGANVFVFEIDACRFCYSTVLVDVEALKSLFCSLNGDEKVWVEEK